MWMCTRFYIEPKTDELMEILEEVQRSRLSTKFIHAGSAILTSGEIKPTNVVPVIASGKDGSRSVFPMKWGFQIEGRPVLVNARIESAAQRPTFKESWERHRCVIPASWYYEWAHLVSNTGREKIGNKYMIQPKGSRMTWLAGLYRIENGLPVFTVLTREPPDSLKKIHDRMPLIFPKDCVEAWISPLTKPAELISHSITEMIVERVV